MRNRRTPSLGDVQSVYCRRVENVGAGVLDRKLAQPSPTVRILIKVRACAFCLS